MPHYLRQLADAIRYPYAPEMLRTDYPHTSFPWPMPTALLAEYGVFPVMDRDPPAYDPLTQDLVELPPVAEAGAWVQAWHLQTVAPAVATERLAQWRGALTCTPRQARLALKAAGLLSAVTGWIAQADEATRIDWEFALEIRRDWAPLLACAHALGLTEAQLDELFILAGAL